MINYNVYFSDGEYFRWNSDGEYFRWNNNTDFVHRTAARGRLYLDSRSYTVQVAGHLHRLDGPACLKVDNELVYFVETGPNIFGIHNGGFGENNDFEVWYINGKNIDSEKYLEWIDETNIDLDNITEDDKLLIYLKWSN